MISYLIRRVWRALGAAPCPFGCGTRLYEGELVRHVSTEHAGEV